MTNEGTLRPIVWPVYIGAAMEGTAPPFTVNEPHNGGYERGQIAWTPVPDARQVIGRARIVCPAGTYTHFVFAWHPVRPQLCGVVQMDHPVVFTALLSVLDVDPIINHDLQLARQLNG